MTGQIWVRSSLRSLRDRLVAVGHPVSAPTVGRLLNTPAFAVDTISEWWQTDGRAVYPEADHLLLLADAGGSNGFQIRA